ncbi:MAG: hypothetical protein Q8873_09370, partial [Bacillota bacterium]|nr:hypothetical protein [Bacillota bacterium]
KTKVFKMISESRIRYFVPADYSEGTDIDSLLKRIIEKTAAYEILETKHIQNHLEAKETKEAEDTLSTIAKFEGIEE